MRVDQANSLHIVHVVRRWGPVGGMEKYVYELVLAQVRFGLPVTVICDQDQADVHPGISVVCLTSSRKKPRWLGMLAFRKKVETKLSELREAAVSETLVIHSHERCRTHDVTTFHGPPMKSIRARKPLWWTSPRLWAWLKMEQAEVESAVVIPNSEAIKNQLQRLYPFLKDRFAPTIGWPGVHPNQTVAIGPAHQIVFVGKEWKRKGLLKAIRVVELVRQQMGMELTLHIVGPVKSDIPAHYQTHDWIDFHGWMAEWGQLGRVLIHPAEVEPYGMVVTEAIAAGYSVLVSAESGVSNHYDLMGPSAFASDEEWASELIRLLESSETTKTNALYSWDDLATDMLPIYSNSTRK